MNTEKRLYLACKALLTPWAENAVAASLEAERQASEAMDEYEMMLGPLPEWAVAHNISDELVEGLQLFTRNGRRHGNAHIVTINDKRWYTVLTDAGSFIDKMSHSEVLEGWEPGDFISDPAAVVKRFGRVPTDLLEPDK